MLVHPHEKRHSLGLKGFGKDFTPLFPPCGESQDQKEHLITGEQRPSLPPTHPHPSLPGCCGTDNTLNPPTASRTSPFPSCWASTEGSGGTCAPGERQKGTTSWRGCLLEDEGPQCGRGGSAGGTAQLGHSIPGARGLAERGSGAPRGRPGPVGDVPTPLHGRHRRHCPGCAQDVPMRAPPGPTTLRGEWGGIRPLPGAPHGSAG